MLRRLLLPLLSLALLSTEAASAQTASVAKPKPGAYARVERPTGRVLTAREKRAAEAAAKAAAAATVIPAQVATASSWNGWSDEPAPQQVTEVGNGQHRPVTNVSVAPGMPINQIGHGVSTDYNGRPIYRTTTASTTLAPGR